MSLSVLQQIRDIEEEMNRTQKNKATNFHVGILKAKLAKLKREVIDAGSRKSGKGGSDGFDVSKSGDARVGLIGFPSVGKSTLLNKLTNTFSEVASYEFTTLTCIPGVIQYKGAKIQLLDLPGIIEGAKDGKGRGRQVIGTARTCNLIMIVLDALKPITGKRKIERELEGFGIRINRKPPNISYKKKDNGGLNIMSQVQLTHLNKEVIQGILREYKIHNADLIFKCNATIDELIDVIEGNRVYIPALYVLNKIDQISIQELDLLDRLPHVCPISAHHEWNMDTLLAMIWHYLNLIRVYTKPKGQLVDFSAPVVVRRDRASVEHLCNKIHRGIMRQFNYALAWGKSVKFSPQRVGKDHLLFDEDIIQVVKRIN